MSLRQILKWAEHAANVGCAVTIEAPRFRTAHVSSDGIDQHQSDIVVIEKNLLELLQSRRQQEDFLLAVPHKSFEIEQRTQIDPSGDSARADGVGIIVFCGDQ